MKKKDEVIPGEKWEFDNNVTEAFDDMLERSIPGFTDMRKIATSLACEFAIDDTSIIDLGCSRGGSLVPIIEKIGVRNHYIGLEISAPMREAAISRFSNLSDRSE